MKLKIKAKLASVLSEVLVSDAKGDMLFCAETEPLSAPRKSCFKDASYNVLATVTTARLDTAKRAHHVVMTDGRTFDLTRKYRNPASTTESIITVENVGWCAVTRRAWTNRFEIRSEDGAVLAEAKQIAAERGDAYELNVKDEQHTAELVLIALIARYIMREDTPAPAAP